MNLTAFMSYDSHALDFSVSRGKDGIEVLLERLNGTKHDHISAASAASLNLAKLKVALQRWNALPPTVSAQVARRVAILRETIEVAPKSLRWRARARIGERLRWYEEVSEVER
jgi:hypothetical protein